MLAGVPVNLTKSIQVQGRAANVNLNSVIVAFWLPQSDYFSYNL